MTSSVDVVRGPLVESRHRVSVAVADREGSLVAHCGESDLVAFWRSAAKPFQLLPVIADGAADRFAMTDEEIAVACGSHSGEPHHVEVVAGLLARIRCGPEDLVLGPQPPFHKPSEQRLAERGETPTKLHHNCSGKHAAMLALARHHGWPTAGYAAADHPVQRRCLAEVARWTGIAEGEIVLATDGCGVPTFGLPIRAMAAAYARLAAVGSRQASSATRPPTSVPAARLLEAVSRHPFLIAGTGRLDTQLLEASCGRIVAKVGAEGVYGAALRDLGLGVALKVEDGDMRSAELALGGVLQEIVREWGAGAAGAAVAAGTADAGRGGAPVSVVPWAPSQELRSSNGTPVGRVHAKISLRIARK